MLIHRERIALILPNRIGDAILTLPVVKCLQALFAADTERPRQLELFCSVPVCEIFAACGTVPVQPLSWTIKARSWRAPPQWVFCLVASSQNFGFRGRRTGGLYQTNKRHVRYDEHLGFLHNDPLEPRLWRYLSEICQIPEYAARFFGIVSRLGYTADQVTVAFPWDCAGLPYQRKLFNFRSTAAEPYLLCCPEAAYGSTRNAYRRWPFEQYMALAEHAVTHSGATVVFIGLDPRPPISPHDRFVDLRGQLTVWELFQLAGGAAGYVGNDTGPLHIANLAGISTLGIYTQDGFHAPLFGGRNTVVIKPADARAAIPSLTALLASISGVPAAQAEMLD